MVGHIMGGLCGGGIMGGAKRFFGLVAADLLLALSMAATPALADEAVGSV